MCPFFLRSIAIIATSCVLIPPGNSARAQHVRYDARSAQGQQMLKIYADAVAKMKTIKDGDPDNWVFQWYTHSVQSTTNKSAAITATYGPNPSAFKDLAQAMWETCQAHHAGDDENNFLVWHRMYVYYFEQIIRDVSGHKDFTLPYWNYSAKGADHGVIPPEFTRKDDPVFKSLYVEKRNPGVNAGQPIDHSSPGALNLDSLAECLYEPGNGRQGFNMRLDGGLHGNVHVLVGGPQNMGSVPWAAGDPIFWLHHCNIDRLWASWNKAGRKNPALGGQFTFAQNRQKVVAEVKEWMDPETEKHGYCYDKLEPVPACPKTAEAVAAGTRKQLRIGAVKSKEIKLESGSAPTRVSVEPVAAEKGVEAQDFHERVKVLPAGKRVLLVLKGLRADAQPGVLYNLYLELPEGAKGEKAAPHLVGSINFFNAVAHGEAGHGKMEAKGPERFEQFDITELSKGLQGKGLLKAKPTVTIAPAGTQAEKANPVIGEISIVEE
ncbi:MAG TPA: tyrosinase family protein [Gemmataceae bacterium]|nr:tyrosinase family protein [Gemmataceae bacterium]